MMFVSTAVITFLFATVISSGQPSDAGTTLLMMASCAFCGLTLGIGGMELFYRWLKQKEHERV